MDDRVALNALAMDQRLPTRGLAFLLKDVFLAPDLAFRDLALAPRWAGAFGLFLLLNLAFTAVWLGQVDLGEFVRLQLEAAGHSAPREAIELSLGLYRVSFWTGAVVFSPIVPLVVAAVLLFVFNFFVGTELEYRQVLAVVSYSLLASALVTLPLSLLVLALRGDWNMDPASALASSLAALVERDAVAPSLYSLLESLDLVSAWVVFLMAVGIGKAAGCRLGTALTGVLVTWGGCVTAKALMVALMS